MRDAPAAVLLNPRAAGGRAAALAPALHQWLQAQAPQVACTVIEGITPARRFIESLATGTRVVLVGGDGTLHQMLPALVIKGCELALVPLGSGNDTARALGVAGLGWADALSHALHTDATPMDLGHCTTGERTIWFASSLTAGFDSAVGLRALNGPSWLRGLPRYLWATLGELAALRSWPIAVQADGASVHDGAALFVSVLNTSSYGGGMPAVPQARIDDGRLDLLVAGAFGRIGTLLMLPRLLAGRHLSHRLVQTRPFTRLQVRSSVEVPLAGDGEAEGTSRAWTVSVQPGALKVVRRRV